LSIIIDCADVVDSQRTVQEALNNMDEEMIAGLYELLSWFPAFTLILSTADSCILINIALCDNTKPNG